MSYREPKPDDREKANKVFRMINEMMNLNPWIEPNIMIAAISSCIAATFHENKYTYEEFKSEMLIMVDFYKTFWGQ